MRNLPALAVLAALLVAAHAPARPLAATQYAAGGTVVVRDTADTRVDDGVLVCDPATRTGVGGGCVAWADAPGADALNATDATGEPVAYQVCVDNDGNSVCGGPQDPLCPDQQFFSHANGGVFFNPLGPLPQGFIPGCRGGFAGWVVFLCTGAHQELDPITGASSGDPHAHAATTGTLEPTTDGTGFGDFCGADGGGAANVSTFAKAYVVAR